MEFALIAAMEDRTQEMAEKVTMARLNLEMKSLLSEIDNDIGNISILMNKHADRCQDIMEDPDKMMNEWADKIFKKYTIK